MSTSALHILTGEYPPALGGVAAYSRLVARALAAGGDDVHVWAPASSNGPLAEDPGVELHTLDGGFRPAALARVGRALAESPTPATVLVQYVPQAFGFRGMNLPFAAWIASLRRMQVWIMFHEVAVPWARPWSLRRNVLAGATHAMAAMVVGRADRTFISIPTWEARLRPLTARWRGATLLPVPSNIPTTAPEGARAAVRAKLGAGMRTAVIGHFGLHSPNVIPLAVQAFLPLIAASRDRVALFIGLGSEGAADALRRAEPAIAGRVHATGALSGEEAAAHLSACDLMVQPYPDGVSGRRGSVMGALGLGRPVATNRGPTTEAFWTSSPSPVAVAPSTADLAAAAETALRDDEALRALGARGHAFYAANFSLERTLDGLRDARRGTAT